MLAELVRELRALAKTADGLEILKVPEVPESLFVRRGDTFDVIDVPPRRRDHHLEGLSDVISAVKDAAIASAPEVYHCAEGIVVLLDRADRRSTVYLRTRPSERFEALQRLRTAEPMTPRDAIRLLRYELHGSGVDALVSALRRADFTRKGTRTASVDHAKESIGSRIEAEVQGLDKLPEDFAVSTPIYTNPGLRQFVVDVRCGITIDFASERVEIRTLADELQRALDFVQESISDALREALPNVPIFHGKP